VTSSFGGDDNGIDDVGCVPVNRDGMKKAARVKDVTDCCWGAGGIEHSFDAGTKVVPKVSQAD
jgi:hypothetical protein